MQSNRNKKAAVRIFSLLMIAAILTGCGTPKGNVAAEQVVADLTAKGAKSAVVKEHMVTAAKKDTNGGGKYDAIDSVTVSVEGADLLGLLPQKIEETVTYKRVKGTDIWEQTDATCSKWDIEHKKIAGTAWKKTEGDKTYYLRISGAVEFFSENINGTGRSADIVHYATSIMSAYAVEENGKVELKRALILSGSATIDGKFTLVMNAENEVPDIVLSDYVKIDKSELPFTEEEYKNVTAGR